MTSITMKAQEHTKDNIIQLGGERSMGKIIDMLMRFYQQQTTQSTLLGRLDSLSRTKDVIVKH